MNNKTIFYLAVLKTIDYTRFNEETEDWSGEVNSVDVNETVTAITMVELHEKLANLCNATISDFDTYFDKETNTFTQEEDGVLADYYVKVYKAEKIEL